MGEGQRKRERERKKREGLPYMFIITSVCETFDFPTDSPYFYSHNQGVLYPLYTESSRGVYQKFVWLYTHIYYNPQMRCSVCTARGTTTPTPRSSIHVTDAHTNIYMHQAWRVVTMHDVQPTLIFWTPPPQNPWAYYFYFYFQIFLCNFCFLIIRHW